MLDGLTKCLNETRVTNALKAMRDCDAWKVIMANLKSRAPVSIILML